ncbi:MAG: RNA polymerase sigma factor [Phycisphaerales bacterium]|nr:RNA polymerase sigma factor [Phycisphaerales bacterium]
MAEPMGVTEAASFGDEHRLIGEAIRGDEASLRELWHRHRRWAAAVLLAHMPREAEVDDLLQEVAMTVVAKISGLREAGAFKPWLRAVTISVAKTAARRTQVRKGGWLKLVGFRGEGDRAAAGAIDRSPALNEGRRLMELCSELPDGYREPLLLKCIHDMSYKQIGEVMGLPDTTIETRIARGRRMLRERAERAGLSPTSDDRDDAGERDGAQANERTDAGRRGNQR